jgi:uncharacterized protein YjbI with pentapeptide repeats
MKSESTDKAAIQLLHSGMQLTTAVALSPKADLTYKLVEKRRFHGDNAAQSLFNGSLLRDCEFESVDFSRCDFEGVNFQNCRFSQTNFDNVDIRSSWFTKCRFEGCSFDDAYIEDCAFRSCEIRDSTFERALLNASTLLNCILLANSFRKGSFTLDIFRDCQFEECTLGDCTFLNHLMISCVFRKIKINAESIGTCFGVTEKDLRGFDLIHLGKNVYSAGELPDIVEALEQEYLTRKWLFALAIVHLNFGRRPILTAIKEILETLLMPLVLNAPIRRDDCIFFRTIVRELSDQERLPVLSCVEIIEKINDVISSHSLEENTFQTLKAIVADTRELLQEMLNQFEEKSLLSRRVLENDVPCTARFTFEAEPTGDLTELLNLAGKSSGLEISGLTVLKRIEHGSFVGVVTTTIFTVAAFQIVLFLVNGCVFQISELRARVQTLFAPTVPKQFKRRALSPPQEMPKWMAGPMQALVASFLKGALPTDIDKKGLGPSNLRAIEIDTQDTDGTPSMTS